MVLRPLNCGGVTSRSFKFKFPRPSVGLETSVGNRTVSRGKLEKAEAEKDKTGRKRGTTGKSGIVRATKVTRRGAASVLHGVFPAEKGCGEEGLGKQTT